MLLRRLAPATLNEKSFDKVVDGVAAQAKKIKLGPGLSADTEMGPLVSRGTTQRVTGYIEQGSEEGAQRRHGRRTQRGQRLFREADSARETSRPT